MRKLVLITALLAVYSVVSAQINRANRLVEYRPAPGQFINNPVIGTPEAAQKITTSETSLVSLGAFGGYIVLGFEQPVKNHPENPYGIDFTIFGNAFTGSSEPGIVWVMRDENGNGLADDTWYQIAGSSYFHPETRHNYKIKWFPAEDGSAGWIDNFGKTGILRKNEFHVQPYYPDAQYFTNFPADTAHFSGTLLGHESRIVNNQIVLPSLAFGFADNQPVVQGVARTKPDNPYTPEIREGAGGDPIDISWAVDENGEYVDLEEIHFVKIATGALSERGVLGEISTEINGVIATEPTGETGNHNLTVIHPHAPEMLINDTLQIFASFFRQGRISTETIIFETPDSQLAGISSNGIITAKNGGKIKISAFVEGYEELEAFTEVYIRQPGKIELEGLESSMMAGELISFKPTLYDQDNNEIAVRKWIIKADNDDILLVAGSNESFTLTGLKPGETTLTVYPERFPEVIVEVMISITPRIEGINLYVTAQSSDENLLPAQWLMVSPLNLNPYVDKRTGDYPAEGYVSLAHVAATILSNATTGFLFRDDEAAQSNLYLYSVEKEGLFNYGWGGKVSPEAFAKSWIIRHNRQHYLNKWNEIPMMNGDTIMLYHVGNILNDWMLSGINSSVDSVSSNMPVELFYWQMRCHRSADGVISESEISPLVGHTIYLENNQNLSGTTNDEGIAQIFTQGNGPWVFHTGKSAVLIHEKVYTNLANVSFSNVRIYPNPADNYIVVTGLYASYDYKVLDIYGRIVSEGIDKHPDVPISIEALSSGVYTIVLEEGGVVERFKFIKK